VNRSAAVALIAGALAVIVVALVVLRSDRAPVVEPAPGTGPDAVPPVEPGKGVLARLYFPGGDERLHAVERELPLEGPPEARARILVLSLIEGPAAAVGAGAGDDRELTAPLPAGVGIRHVFRPEPDLLLVDLEPPDDPAALAMGSRQELLVVYSLVNTLVLNLPEIARVGLLVGGVQRPTFAGHVDTGVPLPADRRLIAVGGSPSG
jgi:hypothetical protein